MAAKALRKLSFLVGASLSLIPLLAQMPAAAATTGTLFGIDIRRPAVVSIDPTTGALTPLADLSLPAGQPFPGLSDSMVSDPANHRLFLVRVVNDFATFPPNITDQLITVDTRTGALAVSPGLPHPGDLACIRHLQRHIARIHWGLLSKPDAGVANAVLAELNAAPWLAQMATAPSRRISTTFSSTR